MSARRTIKFGIEGPSYPWEVIHDVVLFAEKIGFDSYWMPDHLVATGVKRWDALDAWSTLCALAVQTKRIKLATGVSDTYRHHPAALAQMAATCDTLSQGRAILGIGIGEAMNLVPFGIPYDRPVERTVEAVQIIRRLFTEDFVDFKGKYYELKKAFLQPKPAVPISETAYRSTVPIFIAASSPRTMEVTAQYGDGWLPANLIPEEYKSNLEKIRQTAKKYQRDPSEIEPAHFMYTVVAKDSETAKKSIMLTGKMMLLSRPRILEKIGFQPPTHAFEMTFKMVFPRDGESWLAKSTELPDEVVEKAPFVFGTPDDVIEKIDKFVKAGCRHFVMNFQVPPRILKPTCQLFAEKVMPYFKKK
ncbi:MAG: LLM class flavin-dependent oxidoreductase [Candidatus Bathyarchaeota archaeon]|nr:LLM class flavin-dependent oxidoreductase [Candidatus Bathyarchaeota archaeon]MDH5786838.1 LLM class flavin-dependent oxidoreductase [Candidatus Bathyarchaeota archaeon]